MIRWQAPQQVNKSRDFYVTRELTQKVIDACPDAEWRLIVAFSRYGGLRCPSEYLSLRWGDVDWEQGRVRVTSPKTAHHPGGESRVVPLFPELRRCLEEVFEQAEAGTEYVITRYRDMNADLRIQLLRIIDRATRGNAEAAQNAAQYSHESGRTDREAQGETPVIPDEYGACRTIQMARYPLGESNPCLRTENPMSWATRRRGQVLDYEGFMCYSLLVGVEHLRLIATPTPDDDTRTSWTRHHAKAGQANA